MPSDKYKLLLSEQPPDDDHGHENEDGEIDDHFKGSMSFMVLLQGTCKPMIYCHITFVFLGALIVCSIHSLT